MAGHFQTSLSLSNETRISDGRPADAARSAARTLHLTDGRQHAKGIVWHEGAIGGIVSPSRASYLCAWANQTEKMREGQKKSRK